MENGKSAGSFMTGMEVWMRRKDRELKDMADIVSIAKRGRLCAPLRSTMSHVLI